MTSDQKRAAIAQAVNAKIDVPGVPESFEGYGFEFLAGYIPERYLDLMLSTSDGIDDAEAAAFSAWLTVAANNRINIPGISEETEARVIGAAVEWLVKFTRKGLAAE